jgi:hypothetical protein
MPRKELKQFAAAHRAIVEDRFSFDKMVNEILSVYEAAIAK